MCSTSQEGHYSPKCLEEGEFSEVRVSEVRVRYSRGAPRHSLDDGGFLDERTDVRGVPGLFVVRRLSAAWVAGGAPVGRGGDFLGVPERAGVVLAAGGGRARRASQPADFGGAGLPGYVLPRLLGDRLAAYILLSRLFTNVLEGAFSELPLYGVLRSSLSTPPRNGVCNAGETLVL